MTSQEALFELYKQLKTHRRTTKQIIENKQQYEQIWKDLDVLECFRKIPKQKLKAFINGEILSEENYNTWLVSCNCELGKEELTKHLIKIKEWLENE